MDEQKRKEILMILGVGKNDFVRDYSNEPMRFLVDKENVFFRFDEYRGCWYVNNNSNREIWFSQLNGIYISFDKHFSSIHKKYGSCELIMLDGTRIHVNELSYNSFINIVHGKMFEVSINSSFHYYIYNKKEYDINSNAFIQIVEDINCNSYEALSNKIIRKGNCYILTEIEKNENE